MQPKFIYPLQTKNVPFFYIIEHIRTGIYYGGSRSAQSKPLIAKTDSSIFMTEAGYQTSSHIIEDIIQKEGLAAFKIRKIRHFQSEKEALEYETRFLHKIDAKNNPNWYNQTNGYVPTTIGMKYYNNGIIHKMFFPGQQPINYMLGTLRRCSIETRLKMSKSRKGRKRLSRRLPISEETRAKLSKAKKGRIFSIETKIKMSKARKGIRVFNNGFYNKRFFPGEESAGFKLGLMKCL